MMDDHEGIQQLAQFKAPAWQQNFTCLGDRCPDSCCVGWAVHLDKSTYSKYQQITMPQIAELVATNIQRKERNASDSDYALIKLDAKTGECPLIVDGLCGIQSELGEHWLSDVCFSFPRKYIQYRGEIRQSMSLSCPEVARLAFSPMSDQKMTEIKSGVRPKQIQSINIEGLDLMLQLELTDAFIDILRNEKYPLWFAIIVIGLYIERIDKYSGNDFNGFAKKLLIEIAANEKNNTLVSMQYNFEDHFGQFVAIIGQLLDFWMKEPRIRLHQEGKAYIKRVTHVANERGYDLSKLSIDQLVAWYLHGSNTLKSSDQYDMVMRRHVVHLFQSMPSVYIPKFAFKRYLAVASQHCFIRLILALQTKADGNQNVLDEMVNTIRLFARTYQHNDKLQEAVDDLLTKCGYAQMDKLIKILKD